MITYKNDTRLLSVPILHIRNKNCPKLLFYRYKSGGILTHLVDIIHLSSDGLCTIEINEMQ